jgi:hypothetical protein
MMKLALVPGVVAAGVVLALPSGLNKGQAPQPSMPPASTFTAHVDNPWFPLRPGTMYVYVGTKDGKRSREVLRVTRRTEMIDGVPCAVVDDRLYLDGYLEERTTDWYSQDARGNVWYLGENTAELDRGGHVLNTDGTWRAGRDGASAGIFMYAHPAVGQSAVQEHYKGQAEDHFQVLSLRASVRVPFVASTHALLTKEWTPLEPGTIDHKLYVRGIGTVLEQTVQGGSERARLVSVRRS